MLHVMCNRRRRNTGFYTGYYTGLHSDALFCINASAIVILICKSVFAYVELKWCVGGRGW